MPQCNKLVEHNIKESNLHTWQKLDLLHSHNIKNIAHTYLHHQKHILSFFLLLLNYCLPPNLRSWPLPKLMLIATTQILFLLSSVYPSTTTTLSLHYMTTWLLKLQHPAYHWDHKFIIRGFILFMDVTSIQNHHEGFKSNQHSWLAWFS